MKKYKMKLSDEQLKLIEKIGVFLTKQGVKPANARINALLLISDKVELTFDEIRDALNLSKSATSNGLNFLLDTKRVEYVTRPGERKRYFRSNIESWQGSFNENFQFFITFHELLCEVRKIRTKETKEFNNAIDEVTSFMSFAIEELRMIYEKWNLKKNENK